MKLLLICLLLFTTPCGAASYFLSATGNDSNSGTSSGSPWLSPNHALNCGDTITASASTSYSASNFASGKWGTVTCSAGNNVAWIKCATFDACKISVSGADGMRISSNYWGVQGWEVTTTGTGYGCFTVVPPTSSTTIHHIIFANNIANGCQSNAFNTYNNGGAGVDYLEVIGNIAYNGAQSGTFCFSGISIATPVNSDTVSGTHIYVAGNFVYLNVEPSVCAGGTPTDGEGINFDTLDGSSTGHPYTGQMVAYNNIVISNSNRGFEEFRNQNASHATVYVEYNTFWNNDTSASTNSNICGEVTTNNAYYTTFSYNLAMTTSATACGGNTNWAYFISGGNSTVTVTTNWGYSAAGHNGGSQSSSGFSFGTNAFGTNPAFTNATTLGAPSCGSSSSVPACMATMISNFTPTASGSTAYGYQIPLGYSITDPLFPTWLCTVTLPAGLVASGCGAPPTLGSSVGATVGVAGKTSVQ